MVQQTLPPVMACKRLPRFRPVVGALPFKLTLRDENILRRLDQFPVMDSGQISRMLGGSQQGTLRRLQRLFHGGLVRWHRQEGTNATIAYSLTGRGAGAIQAKRGARARIYGAHFRHELMVAEISVRLVENLKGRGEVWFDGDAVPILSGRSHTFRATVREKQKASRITVIPDLIAKITVGGRASYLLVEADRGTMPVARSQLGHSSIYRKLIGYRSLVQSGSLRRALRSRRIQIAIVCSGGKRTENIRALVDARFKKFRECIVTDLEHFTEHIETRRADYQPTRGTRRTPGI